MRSEFPPGIVPRVRLQLAGGDTILKSVTEEGCLRPHG